MVKRFAVFAKFAGTACFAFLVLACADQQPSAPTLPAPAFEVQAAEATPTDEHVVTFNGGIPFDFAARVAMLGGTVAATYPEIGVAVTSGLSDAAADKLARAPGVGGVERDMLVQWIPTADQFSLEAQEAPSDQTDQSGAVFFSFFQWNLRQIDANDAWLTTNQGAGTRVAILDTGIDPGHADLIGKVDVPASKSFITSSPCGAADVNDILDRNLHGSFVAAIVTSRGFAIGSVAPDATLIGVKVLSCSGQGSFAGVIAGIVYAATLGRADVINMSLGAYFRKNLPGGGPLVAALNRATNFANRNGTLVVAAAGNGADDLQHDGNFVFVPAQSANVISVGATGPHGQVDFDQLAFYTNFGVSGVDVMAPGGNAFSPGGQSRDGITSACSRFSLIFPICATGAFYLTGGNGTSFASPHTAGTAAVVKSQFPGASPSQIEHCIYKGADDLGKPGTDQQYSSGRINVVGAAGC